MRPAPCWMTAILLASAPAWADRLPYSISTSQSEVRFTLDAPFDTIVGISHGISGNVRHDPETGATSGRISVDLDSFRTGLSLRDQDLRQQFFHTDRFPAATLTVTRLEGWRVRGDGVREGRVIGTLSLHGAAPIVEIPVEARASEESGRSVLYVRGRFKMVLSDYGITRPKVLFLKLGHTAVIDVNLTLVGPALTTGAPVAERPASAEAPRRTSVVVVARPAKLSASERHAQTKGYRFAARTPQGRAERMMNDPSLGGRGNGLTCAACHSVRDEREGIVDQEGFVRPNRSLFDSAKRPTLWQGLSKTPGEASSLCVRLFMLNPKGLTPEQESDFDAYLKAISPNDAAPALDYRVLALTRKSGLTKPIGGDRALGAKLERQFCGSCHGMGRMRPPLTPGLYEPDYLVQRVRWLPGRDARQMPPIYMDRLTDTDLRHIVTYLAGDESQRIFRRSREKQGTQ